MTIFRLVIIAILIIIKSSITFANVIDDLPIESKIIDGYNTRDSVIENLKQAPLHSIEGVWQFVDNGAEIVIEQYTPDALYNAPTHLYRIIIISSPMLSISPGTIMGYITTTAKANTYDARIYTQGELSGILSKPDKFTLTLNDDKYLSFSKYKKTIKANLWRWLPYVYRIGLTINDTRPKGLDGCIRIYPHPKTPPLSPRYL